MKDYNEWYIDSCGNLVPHEVGDQFSPYFGRLTGALPPGIKIIDQNGRIILVKSINELQI